MGVLGAVYSDPWHKLSIFVSGLLYNIDNLVSGFVRPLGVPDVFRNSEINKDQHECLGLIDLTLDKSRFAQYNAGKSVQYTKYDINKKQN